MRIHKLDTTEAFVAIDLDNAEVSSGPVRWARKILQGGAKDLARSQTYTYAVLGMHRGGASAGISAEISDRESAIGSFVAEARTLVADGTYLPDAAKGVGSEDLQALRDLDPRNSAPADPFGVRWEGLSAAVTADRTVGLDGRTVAIEGFGVSGPALVTAVNERGGSVIAISTPAGTAVNTSGLDTKALIDVVDSGADPVAELGGGGQASDVFAEEAEVMFVGSRMSVVNHGVADGLRSCAAVVPCGRLPVTAKALAILYRSGVMVPADFVALAGATLAAWADAELPEAEIHTRVVNEITELCAEFASHDDGPFLAACYAGESFLSTWQQQLPFGRPLAS